MDELKISEHSDIQEANLTEEQKETLTNWLNKQKNKWRVLILSQTQLNNLSNEVLNDEAEETKITSSEIMKEKELNEFSSYVETSMQSLVNEKLPSLNTLNTTAKQNFITGLSFYISEIVFEKNQSDMTWAIESVNITSKDEDETSLTSTMKNLYWTFKEVTSTVNTVNFKQLDNFFYTEKNKENSELLSEWGTNSAIFMNPAITKKMFSEMQEINNLTNENIEHIISNFDNENLEITDDEKNELSEISSWWNEALWENWKWILTNLKEKWKDIWKNIKTIIKDNPKSWIATIFWSEFVKDLMNEKDWSFLTKMLQMLVKFMWMWDMFWMIDENNIVEVRNEILGWIENSEITNIDNLFLKEENKKDINQESINAIKNLKKWDETFQQTVIRILSPENFGNLRTIADQVTNTKWETIWPIIDSNWKLNIWVNKAIILYEEFKNWWTEDNEDENSWENLDLEDYIKYKNKLNSKGENEEKNDEENNNEESSNENSKKEETNPDSNSENNDEEEDNTKTTVWTASVTGALTWATQSKEKANTDKETKKDTLKVPNPKDIKSLDIYEEKSWKTIPSIKFTSWKDNFRELIEQKTTEIAETGWVFIFRKWNDLTKKEIDQITWIIKENEWEEKIKIYIDQEWWPIHRYVDFEWKEKTFDELKTKYWNEKHLEKNSAKKEIFNAIAKDSLNFFPSQKYIYKAYDGIKKIPDEVKEENKKITLEKYKQDFLDWMAYMRLKTLEEVWINTYWLVCDIDWWNSVIADNERNFANNLEEYKLWWDAIIKASEETWVELYLKHFPGHWEHWDTEWEDDSHKQEYRLVNKTNKLKTNLELFKYMIDKWKEKDVKISIMAGHMILDKELLKDENFKDVLDWAKEILTDDIHSMQWFKQVTWKEREDNEFFSTDLIAFNYKDKLKVVSTDSGIR